MKITKIKIVENGLKGIVCTYDKPEDVSARTYETDYVVTKRYPIHLGLETAVKKLRIYYAEICGLLAGKLDDSQEQYIINDIDILSLKLGNDFFLISGKASSVTGKKIAISTPKVDGTDEYSGYSEVQKIIEEILTEVRAYMAGEKKATDEEFGTKYIQSLMSKGKKFKDGDVTLDMFSEMTAEEKKNYCTSILEKEFGCMVSSYEDLVVDEENATVIELQKVG